MTTSPSSPTPPAVTRWEIVQRGLLVRCPNCGAPNALFLRQLTMNKACPSCGLSFERGAGFFLGSMSINYTATLVLGLLPVAILWYVNVLGGQATMVLLFALVLLFPMAFYRHSRSLWLMSYFYFLPQELPANGGTGVPEDKLS